MNGPSVRYIAPARFGAWVASSAVLLLCCGCVQREESVEPAAARPARPPHVVLISLDTFRWDALNANRPRERSITPNLDRLAAESVRFANMFAQVPHTLSSHASMFTGLNPEAHNVNGNRSALPEATRTLAEILGARSYRTAGIVSSTWLKHKFGMARGFDAYHVISNIENYTSAAEVADWVIERLDGVEGTDEAAPWFFFIHFYEAHSDIGQPLPYWAPAEFLPGAAEMDFCDSENNCATQYLIAADRKRREVSSDEIRAITSLYDAGVAYLDQEFGRLMELLRQRGLYEESLIIVTADHGEEFREHGRFIHSQIYDETTRIPLLVKFPGGRHAGRVQSTLVSTADILPTVLDYLEIPIPDVVQGRSILPALTEDELHGEVVSQQKGEAVVYALRTLQHKLIYDFEREEAQLYDLERDPAERVDLSSEDPDLAAKLLRRLVERLREDRRLARQLGTLEAGAEDKLDAAEAQSLEALGYLN